MPGLKLDQRFNIFTLIDLKKS